MARSATAIRHHSTQFGTPRELCRGSATMQPRDALPLDVVDREWPPCGPFRQPGGVSGAAAGALIGAFGRRRLDCVVISQVDPGDAIVNVSTNSGELHGVVGPGW